MPSYYSDISKCFKALQLNALEKKRRRRLNVVCLQHYYHSLARKFFKAVEFSRTYLRKNLVFRILKNYTQRKKEKAISIENYRNLKLKNLCFQPWKRYYKEKKQRKSLISSVIDWRNAQVASKFFLALKAHSIQRERIRKYFQQASKRYLAKFFQKFKRRAFRRKFCRIVVRKHLERRLKMLQKKIFIFWHFACQAADNEEASNFLVKLYFKVWRRKYKASIRKEQDNYLVLQQYIKKQSCFKILCMNRDYQKQLRKIKKFRLYRAFTNLRLATTKQNLLSFLKKKADSYRKSCLFIKYIQKWKAYTDRELKNRQVLNEKIRGFRITRSFRLLKRYFRYLTENVIHANVEKNYQQRLIQKYFKRLQKNTLAIKTKREERRRFKRKLLRKLTKKTFDYLKELWNRRMMKISFIEQSRKKQLLKKCFAILHSEVCVNSKMRLEQSDEHYRMVMYQRGFYSMRAFMQMRKRKRVIYEKVDWFIEKHLIRYLKTILAKLRIWADVNKRYRGYQAALIYHCFYNWRLETTLKALS